MTIRASGYVAHGQLCIVGVCEDKHGPTPFSVSVPVRDAKGPNGYICQTVPEGPVDFGGELEPATEAALTEARAKVKEAIQTAQLERAVEGLIKRARNGDQNAMAMLAGIGENAKRGHERAQETAVLVRKYLKRNPVEPSQFGLDPKVITSAPSYQSNAAIVTMGPSFNAPGLVCMLADGPPIAPRMRALAAAVESQYQPVFVQAFRLSGEPDAFVRYCNQLDKPNFDAAKIGFLLGRATRLQSARRGNFKALGECVAWELGL